MNSSSQRSSLDDAENIYLYEGLPHQNMSDEFEKESKRSDVKLKAGFHFYDPKLAIDENTAKALKAILVSSSSYKSHTGEKKCGGFHPDFGVFWRVEQKEFSVLICFGCGEIKLIDGDKTHHYDMAPNVESQLETLLNPLAKKRPKGSLLK